jgi:diadenosine tetraphosphate (Ap4A) HIT family hydrolase
MSLGDCVSCRIVAGQAERSLVHEDLHVIPRLSGDPLRIRREGGLQIEERTKLDRVAGQIAKVTP